MKTALTIIILTFSLTFITAHQSKSAVNGCSLHEKHCTSCHDRDFYRRPESKIPNYGQLKRQVIACVKSLGLQINKEEIDGLTECVNRIGYNF